MTGVGKTSCYLQMFGAFCYWFTNRMAMAPWKAETPAHANLLIRRSCVDCIFNQQPVSPSHPWLSSLSVYFTPTTVQIYITNILNITNDNFFTVKAYNLTVQALFDKTVVGTADMKNVTNVKPLTDKTFAFEIPVKLVEEGLKMSMTVYYLAHFEQLSLDTFEYIDCGSNTTTRHLINPTP